MTRKRRPLSKSRERFHETYSRPLTEAELAMEREIFGANEGVRGYTTIAQADALAERLALKPGMRLLDIGAGRGWPGLYLARTAGCRAVLTDLPRPALLDAAVRARRHHVDRRSSFVLASGTALPFRPETFDAVVHTDVL